MNDVTNKYEKITFTIRLINSGFADLPESIARCSFPVKNQVVAI